MKTSQMPLVSDIIFSSYHARHIFSILIFTINKIYLFHVNYFVYCRFFSYSKKNLKNLKFMLDFYVYIGYYK